MSALRERLAARLAAVRAKITAERAAEFFGDRVPARAFLTLNNDIELAMADECIRQMEWVKYEYYRGDHSFHDRLGTAPAPVDCYKCQRFKSPVTAAPDDWSPERKEDK